MEDLVIVGGGPAGLGAALYAKRYSLNVVLIAKELGGTLNVIPHIDNWLGSPGIKGYEMMNSFVEHVKKNDVKIVEDEVSKITKSKSRFVVYTNNKKFECKTVLLANGLKRRELNIRGEKEFSGKGVHYCFICDGPLYKRKIVGVVGGSDSAVRAAIFLSEYANKVYLFYRGGELRAEPVLVAKLRKIKNVEIKYNANLTKIYGGKFVRGVKLGNGKNVSLDGVFIEAGSIPLAELVKEIGVKLNEKGFIIVDRDMSTNVKGVFAAGDISDYSSLKQLITAVASGSIAAQGVYHYLNKK
jgi:thioredoxin reductase (NADPH)